MNSDVPLFKTRPHTIIIDVDEIMFKIVEVRLTGGPAYDFFNQFDRIRIKNEKEDEIVFVRQGGEE